MGSHLARLLFSYVSICPFQKALGPEEISDKRQVWSLTQLVEFFKIKDLVKKGCFLQTQLSVSYL